MATSERYGRVDIPSIDAEEPVFILRARDKLAGDAIKMYRLLAEAHGCDLGEVIERQIRIFNEWAGKKILPGKRPASAH
jgi:hypothetical protein